MKKLLMYLKTLPQTVNILFFSSTIFIILYQFVFTRYDEIIPGANKLGEVLYGLSNATLSGVIFYFFISHISSVNQLRMIYKPIHREISFIVDIYKDLFSILGKEKDIDTHRGIPDEKIMRTIFSDLRFDTILLKSGPIDFLNPDRNQWTVIQLLREKRDGIISRINKILNMNQTAPVKLNEFLYRLKDSTLFIYIDVWEVQKNQYESEDIKILLSSSFQETNQIIIELDKYNKKKKRLYDYD